MAKRDWRKAQPHKATNGKIASRKYATEHPSKVEWVTVKRRKR